MIDITQKFEWNNRKVMNIQRLFSEFMELSLFYKFKVYRFLNHKSRISLRKHYDNCKKDMVLEAFSNHCIKILEPIKIILEESLITTLIKNDYELLITYHIMSMDRVNPMPTLEKAIDMEAEQINFENVRDRLISYLVDFDYREEGFFTTGTRKELALKLKDVHYIKPTTFSNLLVTKRQKWTSIYRCAGVGKERAEEITNELSKWMKKINALNNKEKKDINDFMYTWENTISIEFKGLAKDYFSYIEKKT